MKTRSFLSLVLSLFALAGSCRVPPFREALASGVAAAKDERWDDAVAYWQKVLAERPESAAAHNNLAVAFERKGDWAEARKHYEAALGLEPDNADIRRNYDQFKLRVGAGGGPGR